MAQLNLLLLLWNLSLLNNHVFPSNCRNCVLTPVGLVVSDPERFGGGDIPRGPDRDPVHGEQFWGVANHGEGIHEGCHEDQGGRLPGRALVGNAHASNHPITVSSPFLFASQLPDIPPWC